MNIGVDIDDTIARFYERYLVSNFQLDRDNGGKGIAKKFYSAKSMFDWAKEQFLKNDLTSIKRCIDIVRTMPGARRALEVLRERGHKIIFVTARCSDKGSVPSQTVNWLKNNGFVYDKLVTHCKNKLKALKDNKIELMIEDRVDFAVDFQQNGIKTIVLNNYLTSLKKAPKDILILDSWEEIFHFIEPEEPLSRLPIILDTDVCNQIDDEFAIAYMLKSNMNISAITIAPNFHFKKNCMDIPKNCQISLKKAQKIVKLLKPGLEKNIYLGSSGFMTYDYNEKSEAVEKIIEICKKNEKTLFIEIGAPTNLALALKKCPELAKKIKVLFLAGNFTTPENSEYNYAQDIEATNFVLKSKLDLTIFPAQGVTEMLFASLPFLKTQLKSSPVNDLLLKDFEKHMIGHGYIIKSLYDVCLPIYINHSLLFDVWRKNYGILKTRLDFSKKRFSANFVSHINADKIMKELIKTLNQNEFQ